MGGDGPEADEYGWQSMRTLPVVRFAGNDVTETADVVADEVPVALVYNDVSHTVMLASPVNLEDFAVGFSLTEGIVDKVEDIYSCEAVETANGIALHVHLAGRHFAELKARRRTLAGRTGCGLCGVDSLSAVVRPVKTVKTTCVSLAAIRHALGAMADFQPLFAETGAVHAAAWVDLTGKIIAVREDVGRHNALDKLIGWRAGSKNTGDGFILVSSRASFEMVQKTVQAGVGCLVAISAPTAMAVRLAESCDILLVGFARDKMLTAYTRPERITTG